MTAPASTARTVVRFVLVTIIGLALLLGWFAISYRHTHPRPARPKEPARTRTHRPVPTPTPSPR